MSLRHHSRKLTHSRDSATVNAMWLRRQDLPTCMPGYATYVVTARPGLLPTIDVEVGSTLCQADGRPPSKTQSFVGVFNTE